MNIADRIRSFRQAVAMTQEEMAATSGIPLDSLRKYEGGKTEPGAKALAGLVLAGANANWLLAEQGSMLLAAEPSAGYAVQRQIRLNRDAMTAILIGLMTVNKDPKAIAHQLAEVYETAFNSGQITEDDVGPGDKASAA